MLTEGRGFLIFGTKRSGVCAAKLLIGLKGRVFFYDDRPEESDRNYLLSLGCVEIRQEEYFKRLGEIDCIVLSPSVPVDHPLIKASLRADVNVIGETELAACFTKARILAVTGTDGKSTTVSMICHALKKAGRCAVLAGNIGVPLSEFALKLTERDYAALEISSYQLETIVHFCPQVGVFLNFAPDHLARHGSMENYFAAKRRLFKNMSAGEVAVLNADDQRIAAIARELPAKIYFFSMLGEVAGTYISDGSLYFSEDGRYERIMETGEIPLLGRHNVQNTLAACAALKAAGLSAEEIRAGVMSFTPLKHRLQTVRVVDEKTFVNDSKATNIHAALSGAEAVPGPKVLILGGSGKGEDFCELFSKLPPTVSHCVLTGDTRYELMNAALKSGYPSVTICADFEGAVRRAYRLCPVGGTVLLSPACASFDRFKDFEERGDFFIGTVERL